MITLPALLAGCSKGSHSARNAADAIATVAVAATIAAIQAAQANRPKHRVDKERCARICSDCRVPCGDDCLPYAALCFEPPGRACWENNRTGAPAPEASELCEVAPGFFIELGGAS